jgi:Cdc6-like AAA superfamily ATPase
MGFEAAAWLQDKTDVRGDEHVIAMLLALGADESTGLVYRKLHTLAKHGHMSEHEVIEILTTLEAKGIVDLDTAKQDPYAICIMSGR